MQFTTVAIFAAVASAAANVTTVTGVSSTLVTITSCDETVTDCPYKSHTKANVSTYEGAAGKQYAAGAVALAAGALLAL